MFYRVFVWYLTQKLFEHPKWLNSIEFHHNSQKYDLWTLDLARFWPFSFIFSPFSGFFITFRHFLTYFWPESGEASVVLMNQDESGVVESNWWLLLPFCMNCLQKTTHAQMARIPFRRTYTLILIASSIVGTSKRHLLYHENDTSISMSIPPITLVVAIVSCRKYTIKWIERLSLVGFLA